jgi:hypothetical protein
MRGQRKWKRREYEEKVKASPAVTATAIDRQGLPPPPREPAVAQGVSGQPHRIAAQGEADA